ncbi:efflux RND transporter periplasmic adaptor subunit [Endozoicomonadaceae bacterium StTr2]
MKQTSRTRNYLWLIVSVVLLVVVICGLLLAGKSHENSVSKQNRELLPVTVIHAVPESKQLTVKATGVTEAFWSTPVVTSVSGRVENLPADLEPGKLIAKGTLLVQQQQVDYQAAVDAASSRLAAAHLNYVTARHKQTVALNTANARLKTPYARHEPQVAAAELEENAARSALNNARQKLEDTRINAPFDAIILSRRVTPEQWLQAGAEVFQIASSEWVDVRVELSGEVWRRLGDIQPGTPAQVITLTGARWPAEVRYLSPVRDQKTRQRSLVLKVARPYQGAAQLLPDQQITALFSGRSFASVLELPSSVLTDDGQIWRVDQQNLLRQTAVETLYEDAETVWVRIPEASAQQLQVVRYPLSSMLEGQEVKPDLAENQGGVL